MSHLAGTREQEHMNHVHSYFANARPKNQHLTNQPHYIFKVLCPEMDQITTYLYDHHVLGEY